MGFNGILFLYYILLFIYYPFIIWFFMFEVGWYYIPFIRGLLGFSIIIGNFLLCFGSSLYYLELDFDLGWGYIIYLVG